MLPCSDHAGYDGAPHGLVNTQGSHFDLPVESGGDGLGYDPRLRPNLSLHDAIINPGMSYQTYASHNSNMIFPNSLYQPTIQTEPAEPSWDLARSNSQIPPVTQSYNYYGPMLNDTTPSFPVVDHGHQQPDHSHAVTQLAPLELTQAGAEKSTTLKPDRDKAKISEDAYSDKKAAGWVELKAAVESARTALGPNSASQERESQHRWLRAAAAYMNQYAANAEHDRQTIAALQYQLHQLTPLTPPHAPL